jgi:hypothetical protein
MAINDARAVIDALADPETLYVFGVLAARTSKLGLPVSDRAVSTPYVTPFGLMRETCLSRDVVEAAAQRLKRAGLLEALVDDEGGMRVGGSVRLLWPPRWLARTPCAGHELSQMPGRILRSWRVGHGGGGPAVV